MKWFYAAPALYVIGITLVCLFFTIAKRSDRRTAQMVREAKEERDA